LKLAAKILAAAFLTLVTLAYVWFRQYLPYGSSHCCAKALASGLQMYAEEHAGSFPAGSPTSEASLSLLVKGGQIGSTNSALEILRGKTVPFKMTQAAWNRDGFLGSDSCGWYYVAGLKIGDDPELAVAWDKYGLGHNGQRLPSGGHEVITVDGYRGYITGTRWDEFIEQQRQLLAAHDPPLTNALNAWFTNYALHDSRHEELGH
jgi:hypothetical protein